MASVISVIVTAFITGALARFAVPGPDPMPAWLTILIGLVGTLIGAGIVLAVAGGDPAWIGIAGFFCAIALVLAYRRFVQKRAIWGPDAYRFPQTRHRRRELPRAAAARRHRSRTRSARRSPPRSARRGAAPARGQRPSAAGDADDPTENPAHYLRLLDELHDNGVLERDEYQTARTRLLERLRA